MSVQSIGFGPLKGPDYGVAATATGFSRAANGCVSTVAAALPSFASRLQGDLHTLPPISPATVGSLYVAVGANGTIFNDNFNRVNSSLVGRNWVRAGGDFSILNNRLRSTDASTALLQNFGRVDLDVTCMLFSGQGGPIAWTTSTNGVSTGYAVQVSLSNTGTNVTLLKTNAQVAAGHAGGAGVALGASAVITLSIRGTTVKVLVNYVEVLSYTDGGAQPTGSWSGVATSSAATYDFDDVTIQTPSTLAWVQVGGAGGASLATVAPPQVSYTASALGVSEKAAKEDHTHKSVQFAYDYVVVT